jgi:hypothetical protein
MKIDIYRSARNPIKHVALPAGTDPKTFVWPVNFDEDYAVLILQSSPDISPADVGRIAFDSADVIRQIEQQGYAVLGATVTVNVHTSMK